MYTKISVYLLAALLAATGFVPSLADYHHGDLVPTARRAQFHGQRTHWHDLTARHCPKFGEDHAVAVPIPKPTSWREDDEYKISLSFEGDRHLTGWLLVMSKSIREAHEEAVANAGRGKRTSRFDKDNKRGDEELGVVPMLDIEITHGRGEIRAVKADTVAVGRKYLKTHRSLVEEFHNHTVWPKHLLVRYRWTEKTDVDAKFGSAVLLGMCAAVGVGCLISACAAYNGSIADFVDDIFAEEDGVFDDADAVGGKHGGHGGTGGRHGGTGGRHASYDDDGSTGVGGAMRATAYARGGYAKSE
jgi:hypothetical protein